MNSQHASEYYQGKVGVENIELKLWADEIKLLHEDIRILEQNIVRAAGLFLSALILATGVFLTLKTNLQADGNMFNNYFPFFALLLSLIGSAFLVGTSYLGHGIVRCDIYIRNLNNLSKEKYGILVCGWEEWKHKNMGKLGSKIERRFYSLGHGIFVAFTCMMSSGAGLAGLISFLVLIGNVEDITYLQVIAWLGFSFSVSMFVVATLFFLMTSWIAFDEVYKLNPLKKLLVLVKRM